MLGAVALAPAVTLARPVVARADEAPIDLSRWMAGLADDAPLSAITIPGTHDSGARFGGAAPVVDFVTALWVQAQNWTVTQQLNAGVRFLDVRPHAEPDGTLRIHHLFVDEQLSLTDVLRECVAFLAANPTEALLMRVQQEASTMPEPQFVAAFDRHVGEADAGDRLYRDPTIPRLQAVRGAIVLMPNNLPAWVASAGAARWCPSRTTGTWGTSRRRRQSTVNGTPWSRRWTRPPQPPTRSRSASCRPTAPWCRRGFSPTS